MRSQLLVVDDNPDICHLLKAMLEADGHEVSIATGGRVALEMCGCWHYDLAIIDIVMPDMSGLELADKLLDLGTRKPAIILITADADERLQAARRAQEALGIYAIVTKPFHTEDLRMAVREAVGA